MPVCFSDMRYRWQCFCYIFIAMGCDLLPFVPLIHANPIWLSTNVSSEFFVVHTAPSAITKHLPPHMFVICMNYYLTIIVNVIVITKAAVTITFIA